MDVKGNPNSVIDSHQNSGESTTTNTEAQEQTQSQIDWEKRFKDTQAAYTQSRQELAATKAELQAAKEMQQFAMPADVKARLDELKFSDPDAWRVEMNAFEQSKTAKFNELHANNTEAILSELSQADRVQTLLEFNRLHGVEITESLLQNEIPNRIHNELNSGTIDYATYLAKCVEYMRTPKVIAGTQEVLGQPNIGKIGGGATPGEAASNLNIETAYKSMVL